MQMGSLTFTLGLQFALVIVRISIFRYVIHDNHAGHCGIHHENHHHILLPVALFAYVQD